MRNPKFAALTAEMNALHDRKNADYASDGNPYSNFEQAAHVVDGFSGVDAVFAALIGVKLARLRELTSAGKTPNNESIDDTRTDLAMYAALWASYYRPVHDVVNAPAAVNTRPTYDERRSDIKPCKCGAIFTHPHLCDARGSCEAAKHPHFRRPLTLADQRSRTP
jgi:hypothetical protein